MTKHISDYTNWKWKDAFNFILWTLGPSILAGFGMFYIETIVLENSLSSGLLFALLITSNITVVASLHQSKILADRLEKRGNN